MTLSEKNLNEALFDIIAGKGVKRSMHELHIDGRSVVEEFMKVLQQQGFEKTVVGKVDVNVGERVPAFYVDDSVAYFGWVFWEKFTPEKARKLWGSVIRNIKGDWAIQISDAKPTTIYANQTLKIEMDADHPVTL